MSGPEARVAGRGGAIVLCLGALLALALVVALAVQALYVFREDLYRVRALEPWVMRLCARVEGGICTRRDVSVLRFLHSERGPHPSADGVLRVAGAFRNDGSFAQRLPDLGLRFLDPRGVVVAAGVFEPAQYLVGDFPAFVKLQPGQEVEFALHIRDPGPGARSFLLAFH